MRHFSMHDNAAGPDTDVVILAKLSDVHHEDLVSLDLFVDPWRLFHDNDLILEENWIIKGAVQEHASGPTRKRRKLYMPSVSWALPADSESHQKQLSASHEPRQKSIYTYKTLDTNHFRLLYLLPGALSDQLQGAIVHVPQKSADQYWALSYVWGRHRQTHELLTPDGILRITSSLDNALHGLRHRDTAMLLWVDAICINQGDNDEKAQQIRL